MSHGECYAVILAGGRGERFWPMSTAQHPKQLLSLVGNKPLIAAAVDRLAGLIPPERVFIITNADLVEPTATVLPGFPKANIIGEPFGRDTAAAIALGAVQVEARDPQAAFCVLTADHVIGDIPLFQQTLKESFAMAQARDVLLTIGLKPTEPSTGFGYIEAGAACAHAGTLAFSAVRRFVEKPDRDTARAYIESGRFFWNSGMFIWSLAAFNQAVARHRPPLEILMNVLRPQVRAPDFNRVLSEAYGKLDKISVDYALMEKASNIVMVRGEFPWDDVGSWNALECHFPKDDRENVWAGEGAGVDASQNIAVADHGFVALVGVQNLIVVKAGDAVLVCAKDRAQDVKKMVEVLKQKGRADLL